MLNTALYWIWAVANHEPLKNVLGTVLLSVGSPNFPSLESRKGLVQSFWKIRKIKNTRPYQKRQLERHNTWFNHLRFYGIAGGSSALENGAFFLFGTASSLRYSLIPREGCWYADGLGRVEGSAFAGGQGTKLTNGIFPWIISPACTWIVEKYWYLPVS